MAGIEPEFIAMKYDEDGKPIKAIDSDPIKGIRPRRQAFGYDVEHSLDSMHFFKELIDILEELGWNLHDVVAEGAYSQFELDFHYTNLLEMADRLVFLRILLKEIAKKHNRSEEHTSELQSLVNLVCRLLLEKKKNQLT